MSSCKSGNLMGKQKVKYIYRHIIIKYKLLVFYGNENKYSIFI